MEAVGYLSGTLDIEALVRWIEGEDEREEWAVRIPTVLRRMGKMCHVCKRRVSVPLYMRDGRLDVWDDR